MRTSLTILTAGVLTLAFATESAARAKRPAQIPNGDVHNCLNCHVAFGGDVRTAFGLDIEFDFLTQSGSAGDVLWNADLAELDSDGDGFTNGEELGDKDGDFNPERDTDITNPGDPDDFPPEGVLFDDDPGDDDPGDGDPVDGDPGGGVLDGDPPVDAFVERLVGIVEEVELDDFGGTIRLEGRPFALLEGAELIDGDTGGAFDLEDLEIGEHIVLLAVFDREGQALVHTGIRAGEPEEGVPSLWVEFGGVIDLADGSRAVLALGKEFAVGFDALYVLGPDRLDISPEEIVPGDRVAIDVLSDEFATVVSEIWVDPAEPQAEPGTPGDGDHPPFWDFDGVVFDVDSEARLITFQNDPIFIDDFTEFSDAFGSAIDAEDLFPDDPLVILIDFETHTALSVEILEEGRDYSHLFDDPEIGVYFASFIGFEDDQLLTYDSFARSVAIDVEVFNQGDEEDVTGTVTAEDLVGEFVRARIRHQQPGEQVGDVVVALLFNLRDEPLAEGEHRVPTEFFGEWPMEGFVAAYDAETMELIMEGIALEIVGDTFIGDRDGFAVATEDLPGQLIAATVIPTSDPDVVLAREIRTDPEFPPEGFPPNVIVSQVLDVDGDFVFTDGGRWPVLGDARLFDGFVDEERGIEAYEELEAGEFVTFVLAHTDVGDFVIGLERNPFVEEFDAAWEGDFEVFAFDPETGEIRFAGPPIEIVSRTEFLNENGRSIDLSQIETGTPIIVDQAFSASGGPPVARSVRIQGPEFFDEGPNAFYTNFAGVEGDFLLTVEHARFLAADVDISRGAGDIADIGDLGRGVRVRALIQHPPPGRFSVGDVITRIVIDPERGSGPIARPVETGQIEGHVAFIDPDERLIILEGPVVQVGDRTEIIGLDRDQLVLEEIEPGELLAVNFTQAGNSSRRPRSPSSIRCGCRRRAPICSWHRSST